MEFATYELQLYSRLEQLQRSLRSGRWFDELPSRPSGRLWVTPKGAAPENSDEFISHIGPVPAGNKKLVVDVRTVFAPAVDFAICEVLYLWNFGAQLEATLLPNALGNRLAKLNPSSPRLFRFWPAEYESFRQEPLQEAQRILRSGSDSRCRIISTDFSSFYENIKSEFLIDPHFVNEIWPDSADPWRSRYLEATSSLLRVSPDVPQSVRRCIWRCGEPWDSCRATNE